MTHSETGSLPRARAGFTLLEVLVALSIAGMVLLGARAMLAQLADAADRIARAAASSDREANAERLLRALVAGVEASDGSTIRFVGDERAARFVTWCEGAGGWQERCAVTIGLVPRPQGVALAALFPDGTTMVLRDGLGSGALRYLHSAGDGGTWLHSWQSTVTTPLAIGVVADGDTLILRIGERG
jgi:prepilin-type N-terminal cleavage/methylation domain-containing protein